MAVGAFPLFKLGFLLIKQISKPIANTIAKRAKSSRIFREYVCIPTAQLFHWYDVRVRMRILNLGKATTVPKLNEQKAIETGSQLLSELIIFGFASGILVFEYNRQSENEEIKKEKAEREKAYLLDRLETLELTMEKQSAQMRELERLAHHLGDKLDHKTKNRNSSEVPAPTTVASGEVKNISYENDYDGVVLEAVESVLAPEIRADFDISAFKSLNQKDFVISSAEYVLNGCEE